MISLISCKPRTSLDRQIFDVWGSLFVSYLGHIVKFLILPGEVFCIVRLPFVFLI